MQQYWRSYSEDVSIGIIETQIRKLFYFWAKRKNVLPKNKSKMISFSTIFLKEVFQ